MSMNAPVPPPANPATSLIVGRLDELIETTRTQWQTLIRREKQSPGLIRVTPALSPMGEGIGSSSLRLRATQWVLAVGAAGAYVLMHGQQQVARIAAAGANTFVIPLTVTIDSGLAVTTVAVAGGAATDADIFDSFLIVYTDDEEQR